MTAKVEAILEQTKSLTPDELERLIVRLRSILTPSDPDVEAAWTSACEERLAAIERGEVRTPDADMVAEELRALLARNR